MRLRMDWMAEKGCDRYLLAVAKTIALFTASEQRYRFCHSIKSVFVDGRDIENQFCRSRTFLNSSASQHIFCSFLAISHQPVLINLS